MRSNPRVEKDLFGLDIFSTGFFWVSLVIGSRVDLIVLVLFLEAFGVREYCSMAVESR